MRPIVWVAVLAVAGCASKAAQDKRNVESTTVSVKKLAFEDFPQWAAAHADKACPDKIDELFAFEPRDAPVVDAWHHAFKMMCGPNLPSGALGIAIESLGPDGKDGTADDIKSWDQR